MCGEHRSIVGIGVACQGSSPHVRGARLGSTLNAAAMGIIPACAGSTLSINHAGTPVGSSPHVRGAPLRKRGAVGIRRIIPACAGSTCWWRCCCPCWWDHPRMCGEHSLTRKRSMTRPGSSPHVRGAHRRCSFVLETKKGSSPHVRGAPLLGWNACQGKGIIPACAGSTARKGMSLSASRDHPRMCGEHAVVGSQAVPGSGSSPHVRGAHGFVPIADKETGIIPACAGSTRCILITMWNRWDHPRMCGEHNHSFGLLWFAWGSSPHVRGAPGYGGKVFAVRGIIPACAGSTECLLLHFILLGDHPRMCGEH